MTIIGKLLEEYNKIQLENKSSASDNRKVRGVKKPIHKILNEIENMEDINLDNVVDLSNDFSEPPSVEELKEHIKNLINNGIKYDTLSPDWKIDIIGNKDKVGHLIKSSEYGKLNKSKDGRHRRYIANIEDLIKKSTYTNSPSFNRKHNKKPNVAMYHYFETFVNVKGKIYKVI